MKKAIVLCILLVLAVNAVAEDLQLKGVTITVIDKAVFKYGPVSGNNDPSCAYYMNDSDKD